MSIAPDALFPEVLSAAAKEGAEMLIRGLRDGVHVPPLLDVGWKAAELEGKQLVHAPKVTKADGRIHWSIWTADQFATRVRVLGSVWTLVVNEKSIRRRILFLDAEPVADGLVSGHVEHAQLVCEDETVAGKAAERHHVKVVFCEDGSCLVDVCHGSWVRVGRVKVEGKPEQIAAVALKSWAR
jgi:methionyl-tRNA formyltransferase